MPTMECANPLLLGFVKEWLDLAEERNTKGVTVYKRAYNSLKVCPIEFHHPSEAMQLNGFGPKLCERLTKEMNDHCERNGLPMPQRRRKSKVPLLEDDDTVAAPVKKARKPKAYVPAFRSGPYGLILALSTLSEFSSSGLTKGETIQIAQPHCDSSYEAPSDPSKFYTAWNSIKTLVEKDLVTEKGRPKRYVLTDEGWDVAKRIRQTLAQDAAPVNGFEGNRVCDDGFDDIGSSPERSQSSRRPNIPPEVFDVVPVGDSVSNEMALPTFSPISLRPSQFSVELVVDIREIRSKTDRDYMQEELTQKGIKPIMRTLELGDAIWIAKCKDSNFLTTVGAEGDEVILDWIVERKRLDDLVGSIKDGRFHEQKFRLRKMGVKNVVYIIEETSVNADHFQKYEEAVESAIASLQVVNGYFLKKTQNMDDTIRYLARMTKLLKNIYESKPLQVIPTRILTSQNFLPLLKQLREREPGTSYNITYPAFASLASKSENLTLRDVFLKMLMCTKGVTGEKALEIQQHWKTPQEFVKAFDRLGNGEDGKKRKREFVASKMVNLVGRKKIGKAVSQTIAEVWADI